MILVLAGTTEARNLINKMNEKHIPLIASTYSEYGKKLIGYDSDNVEIYFGALEEKSFSKLIVERKITTIIDATHPFAEMISRLAITIANEYNIEYIRYERPSIKEVLEKQGECLEFINEVKDFESASKKAVVMGGNVFSAIGSNHLMSLSKIVPLERLYVRILPQKIAIEKCEKIGILPSHIFALQGPFSVELNVELLKKCNASCIISKDSGMIGGVKEKIKASQILKIPIFLIQRPCIKYPKIVKNEKLEEFLNKIKRTHYI